MLSLDDISVESRITGLHPEGYVTIKNVDRMGTGTLSVIYVDQSGNLGSQLLTRDDEERLSVVSVAMLPPLDADANEFTLAAEASRFRLAYLYDPLLAVNTSAVEPLPHQISAVYEHMLDRQPLRFLLADDPGAGKTIMAGLLVKELILRGDVERCLIVVPGNLAEQWQDELRDKFQIIFEIMTNDKLSAAASGNWLKEVDLVIARLDKLSRDEDLRPKLLDAQWDLVIFDEAHKLSASRFGNEVKYTRRFQLARELSPTTRHLLLMTATPHNGKEEDFQLFLSLLDGDRFEGRPRDGVHQADYSDLMRRLIKEQLVRFDNSPLFPERAAYTVKYELSDLEASLYEEVTRYVREEFNRADRLDEKRRGTVGFALTVLQRRLASSPLAIHSSLERRRKRLEDQIRERELLQRGAAVAPDSWRWLSEEELEDLEDAPDDEASEAEETAMLRATTAETIEELKAEIATLTRLEKLAFQVVQSGQDRKWQELSRLVQEDRYMFDDSGARRKLVIFTEHKDTLKYLHGRIRKLLGTGDTMVTISGGMAREARKVAEARFKQDAGVHILLATDAAGEGINLQRAHLMVNYDLPWNPNRLEQRFGRIHRIGQTEVCRLWNLVAHETREGQVFDRLLSKLKIENEALSGRVFDVLGTVFEGKALRDLLIQAIRAGGETDAEETLQAIDRSMDHTRLRKILDERALAFNSLESSTVQRIREQMARARVQRLLPYYIEAFFREAFSHNGGVMRNREKGRYEIRNVPVEMRRRDRVIGTGAPLLHAYERITFHPDHIEGEKGRVADLVAPGHPLLDTVIDITLERYRHHLKTGTIFIDRNGTDGSEPYAMVVLEHAILEGYAAEDRQRRVASRRLMTVRITADGTVEAAGSAPWLDLNAPEPEQRVTVRQIVEERWNTRSVEDVAVAHAAEHLAPEHFAEVDLRRKERTAKVRAEVMGRLSREIAYWDHRAEELRLQEQAGKGAGKLNSENARRRRDDLHARLAERLRTLDGQAALSSQVPVIRSIAMVVPEALLQDSAEGEPESPYQSLDAEARRRIEVIAMNAVMEKERAEGNVPVDISSENRGYDIESRMPDGTLRFIEVKGRVSTADEVTVTRNEMHYGFNEPERFVLAIVLVEQEAIQGPHYVREPFTHEPMWGMSRAVFVVSDLLNS